jgi:hypothetical protein
VVIQRLDERACKVASPNAKRAVAGGLLVALVSSFDEEFGVLRQPRSRCGG